MLPNPESHRPSDRPPREALSAAREEMVALEAALLKSGTMSEAEHQLSQSLRAKATELMQPLGGNLQAVTKLMGDRLIVGADYQTHLKLDLGKEGRLPVGIEKILTSECAVYGAGKKVYETHILAWVPAGLSLVKLSKAVGGQRGEVLYSDWFTVAQHRAFGEASLSSGKWILIPDKCPPDTKGKNWSDTVEALKLYPTYEQSDGLSFATALIMRERKSGERHYRQEWAWCNDRLSSAAGAALHVGYFSAYGLYVSGDDHGSGTPWFGAAASWNFNYDAADRARRRRGYF